jgi:DNA polymerase-3 subunit epsilon
MTFTSIDFETANYSAVSLCAAGIAVFENGALAEAPYWLVRPPKGHGWFREDFTEIHGLTRFDVQDAPEFLAIAPELLERLARADIVIAHVAQFDIGVLRATLDYFGLVCPAFDYLCTCRVARRIWPDLPNHKLNTLAAHIGHDFHHHHAQSDAEAAGRVLLAMMKYMSASTPSELLQKAGLVFLTGQLEHEVVAESGPGCVGRLWDPASPGQLRLTTWRSGGFCNGLGDGFVTAHVTV